MMQYSKVAICPSSTQTKEVKVLLVTIALHAIGYTRSYQLLLNAILLVMCIRFKWYVKKSLDTKWLQRTSITWP